MSTTARIRPARLAPRLLMHAGLIAGAIVMLYPLLWMVSSSVKPNNQIFTDLSLWPRELRLENYSDGWSGIGVSFRTFFLNSFVISTLSVIGNVLSCSITAYAFARLEFRFKSFWFAVMLMTLMLPLHVLLVPQYVLFRNFGWLDSILPLTVPNFLATDAFFIFLIVQFIRGLPRELDQAAEMDGASPWQVYWQIIVPLCVPALVTTAIFTFIWSWNDFLSQLIYLNSVDNYTVSLGLRLFLDSVGVSSWGPMLAMSTLALIPVFVLFLLFQRLLVEGIATTGLKG
ncbi:MAG TPA: carbohydrate ABC transporter permease [Thermomicrobiales bacterium]|nr:carbohydrate ABC transporter permease [Thermomicrobiales bacterium]